MPLIAYLDFKCSASLLALAPIVALAERHGLTIDWRPYSTAERDLPDQGAEHSVIASHRRTRLQSRRDTDAFYAGLRGIDLTFPESETASDCALGALAAIQGERLPFIRACFDAYWQQHRDLDDPGVVANLIAASGAAHPGDLSGTREVFAAAQAEAEAAGIVDAPAFVIDGQVFIGRQHLPWIEEIAREA